MSDRALDVLAYVGRALDPERPLIVDPARRHMRVREARELHAAQLYFGVKIPMLEAQQKVVLGLCDRETWG